MTAHYAHHPSDADIRETEEMVLSTFLQTPAVQIPRPADTDWPGSDEVWTGCTTVGGTFTSVITVSCTTAFARQATALLVPAADEKISDDDARDMLAELTNIVGGNIKSLFSLLADSTCQLSLPIVAVGRIEVPDATTVSEIWYACARHRIVITVFEAKDPAVHLRNQLTPGASE